MVVNVKAIAKVFGFRLCVTWQNLTDEERAMTAMGGKSVNGAAGYFFNLRNAGK
tara:strand:- start:322 stop:483 length:162 start_codon:yes stop_codon:yes gene_type:complete